MTQKAQEKLLEAADRLTPDGETHRSLGVQARAAELGRISQCPADSLCSICRAESALRRVEG